MPPTDQSPKTTFAARIGEAIALLTTLSTDINATYPNAEVVWDSIDLAVQDLEDARDSLVDFDPDHDPDDDDNEIPF